MSKLLEEMEINADVFDSMVQTSGTSDWVVGVIQSNLSDDVFKSLFYEALYSEPDLRPAAKEFKRLITGTMLFGEGSIFSSYAFMEIPRKSDSWILLELCRRDLGLYAFLTSMASVGGTLRLRPIRLSTHDWSSFFDLFHVPIEEDEYANEEWCQEGVSVLCTDGVFKDMYGTVLDTRGNHNARVIFQTSVLSVESPPVSLPISCLEVKEWRQPRVMV